MQTQSVTQPITSNQTNVVIGEIYRITEGKAASPVFELVRELAKQDGQRVYLARFVRDEFVRDEEEFEISETELINDCQVLETA